MFAFQFSTFLAGELALPVSKENRKKLPENLAHVTLIKNAN